MSRSSPDRPKKDSPTTPAHTFTAANLATQIRATGRTFIGYSESLPATGYTGCSSGSYARKHTPWVDFPALPESTSQPSTAFPSTFSRLPTLSIVIPNLSHDMHDVTVAEGDQWLQQHLSSYARWASTNNSLLVLTWDEDDHSQNNQIPTIVTGDDIRPGHYSEHVTHYPSCAPSNTSTPSRRSATPRPPHLSPTSGPRKRSPPTASGDLGGHRAARSC